MPIKNRQQLLIIVTVAAVALFAADKIILTPLTNLWSARSKEITKLETDNRNAKALAKQEQRLRARWDEMRRNTLPQDESLAGQQLLRAVDATQPAGSELTGGPSHWSAAFTPLPCPYQRVCLLRFGTRQQVVRRSGVNAALQWRSLPREQAPLGAPCV